MRDLRSHPSRPTRRAALGWWLASSLRAAAKDRGVIQFIFGTYGMGALSTSQAIATVAKTGYDGVELAVLTGAPSDAAQLDGPAIRDIGRQMDRLQLAVPALLDNLPLLGEPAVERRTLERIRLIAEVAHGVSPKRTPVLDTVLGGKPADWDTQHKRMAEKLRAWARVAEAAGLTIAIKPHASHAMNSPERALHLLREVSSPRIRLVYDYSHFHVEGFGLEESLRQLVSSTALISVKDSVGKSGAHRYLLPGDGDTDYAAYFRLLAALGYCGGIGVEVSSMIHRQPGYEPSRAATVCYQRLAPLIGSSGLVRKRMP